MKSIIHLTTLCLILAHLSGSASAQSYSINLHTIDGGGGTSTGGVFSVSGTIGQHDANGTLTGGVYTVAGGFWPAVTLLQSPSAPQLASELQPGGSVRIYWPIPATGFVLEQTSTFASPPAAIAWTQVPFPYQTNASQISITVSPAAGRKFYRLRHP